MKQALVVGGSGMLAKTSLWLAENGYKVSVIGRNQEKLDKLCQQNGRIVPVSVDYRDDDALSKKLERIIRSGAIEMVVAWIHNDVAPNALQIVIDKISKQGINKWRLFHVLGSGSNLDKIRSRLEIPAACEYRQVQLGFVLENNRSRWLTNDEIANGVIEAIRTNKNRHLVGTLTPGNKRPDF
ncbi:short-chain dehydrogenase [Paenibacillus thermoaerophilus]|nr:short-chain dehydrogenase [Paenibacillus thermoaerophilus]